MVYYVYMLKSVTPLVKKTYVGFSNNVKLRLSRHNSNKGAKSTKGYKWKIIYQKRFNNKSDALSFEYHLKKNRTLRKKILNLYN